LQASQPTLRERNKQGLFSTSRTYEQRGKHKGNRPE
jgi:hypothetical protein